MAPEPVFQRAIGADRRRTILTVQLSIDGPKLEPAVMRQRGAAEPMELALVPPFLIAVGVAVRRPIVPMEPAMLIPGRDTVCRFKCRTIFAMTATVAPPFRAPIRPYHGRSVLSVELLAAIEIVGAIDEPDPARFVGTVQFHGLRQFGAQHPAHRIDNLRRSVRLSAHRWGQVWLLLRDGLAPLPRFPARKCPIERRAIARRSPTILVCHRHE